MNRMLVTTSVRTAMQSTRPAGKTRRESDAISASPAKRRGLKDLAPKCLAYVDHPAFANPEIEALLFGADGEKVAKKLLPFRWPLVTSTGSVRVSQQAPVFSPADEQCLFMRLNYARRAVAKLREAAAGRALTVKELRLLQEWERRVGEARTLLVQANLRLVIAMLQRFSAPNADWSEFVSDGNVTLLRCVDLFDCSRGFKFSTYCCNALFKSFNQVVVRANRYRGWFPLEFSPTMTCKSDFDIPCIAAENEYLDALKGMLHRNLANLNETERFVVQERFGFMSGSEAGTPKTLKRIGQLLGITKERVRQIQTNALRKLRMTLEQQRAAA